MSPILVSGRPTGYLAKHPNARYYGHLNRYLRLGFEDRPPKPCTSCRGPSAEWAIGGCYECTNCAVDHGFIVAEGGAAQ